MQCSAFHREGGPEELRPVGETEFAAGIAAMSASGIYGSCRVAAGIISTVDLNLGRAKVETALLAHMAASGNFRGIRAPLPESGLPSSWCEAYRRLGAHGLLYEFYHHDYRSNLPRLAELAARHPETTIVLNHLGGKIDFEAMESPAAVRRPTMLHS